MKKSLLFITLIALVGTSAIAELAAPEGYTGTKRAKQPDSGRSYTTKSTVAQAKKMPDDSYVVLQGKITQHLRKDKYTFKDQSGEITIEIDDDKWRGLSVAPNDLVEIQGEIDKDWQSTEIDVDVIRIIR